MQGLFIKSPILKIVLGILASLIAIALVLVVLLTEETRMEAQTGSWQGREIENGAALFANNCASCHGPDGRGGAGPALRSHYFFTDTGRLADVGWAGTLYDYVELTVAAGRPSKTSGQWSVIMPTWGQAYGGPMRDDQVRAVTAYVVNWQNDALAQTAEEDPWIPFQDVRKPVSQQSIDPPPLEEGTAAVSEGPLEPDALFTSMGCVACHNLTEPQTADNRGPVGPNMGNLAENAATRVEGLSAAEYVHQSIVEPSAYLVDGYMDGLMPKTFAETMSEDEINALVEWLLVQSGG